MALLQALYLKLFPKGPRINCDKANASSAANTEDADLNQVLSSTAIHDSKKSRPFVRAPGLADLTGVVEKKKAKNPAVADFVEMNRIETAVEIHPATSISNENATYV